MPPDIIKREQEEAQGIMYRTISDLQIGHCSMGDAQEKVDELVATIIANIGRELEARVENLEADEGWKNNNIYTGGYDQATVDAVTLIRSITGISPTG